MKNTNRGQSMVEIVVVLGICGIVLMALVLAAINSLKNSQYAQNQAKATKYAQDAIEKVQTIREWNSPVTLYSNNYSDVCVSFDATLCASGLKTCPFSELWSCKLSDNIANVCSHVVSGQQGCYFSLISGPPLTISEVPNLSQSWETDSNFSPGFTRQIFITDETGVAYDTAKHVFVKVKWTDSSGDHQSNLETLIYKR